MSLSRSTGRVSFTLQVLPLKSIDCIETTASAILILEFVIRLLRQRTSHRSFPVRTAAPASVSDRDSCSSQHPAISEHMSVSLTYSYSSVRGNTQELIALVPCLNLPSIHHLLLPPRLRRTPIYPYPVPKILFYSCEIEYGAPFTETTFFFPVHGNGRTPGFSYRHDHGCGIGCIKIINRRHQLSHQQVRRTIRSNKSYMPCNFLTCTPSTLCLCFTTRMADLSRQS